MEVTWQDDGCIDIDTKNVSITDNVVGQMIVSATSKVASLPSPEPLIVKINIHKENILFIQ